jgi:hypothetical protein
MPIELQPVLSGVRAANLDRYPDNGLPYALTIELAPGARVTDRLGSAIRSGGTSFNFSDSLRFKYPPIFSYPQTSAATGAKTT